MAWFISSPVSRTIPNDPSRKPALTSSEVSPISATSKSQTAPAPLSAIAVTTPRRIKSMRIGLRPHLMTCAPTPTITGWPVRRAATMACTIACKSSPARIAGSDAKNSVNDRPGCGGCANRWSATLFWRIFRVVVRIRPKSRGCITAPDSLQDPVQPRYARVEPCHSPLAAVHRGAAGSRVGFSGCRRGNG
jgi:hypothetical protein